MKTLKHTAVTRVGRRIDRVMRESVVRRVRMIAKPGRNTVGADPKNLANSQRAKDHMALPRATLVLVAASPLHHVAEPAEKQKQVPGTDALVREMLLRRPVLPEAGKPPTPPRTRSRIQIRIEVGEVFRPHSGARQVGDELTDVVAPMPQRVKRDGPALMRDGQRNHPAVRQNGARAAAACW